MNNSVDLLRSIKKHTNDNLYYHDINIGLGLNKVIAKAVKVESIIIMKMGLENIEEKEYRFILKMYNAITAGRERLHMSPQDIEIIKNIQYSGNGLDDFPRLPTKMVGKLPMEEDEIMGWVVLLSDIIKKSGELTDISKHFLRVDFDDGLNNFSGVIDIGLAEIEDVEEGGVYEIDLMENGYIEENNYIIGKTTKEELYEVMDVKRLDK